MPLDPQHFRDVLRRFATGVTVVTTRDGERMHGLTVSAFSSVSATPPRVLVCLGNATESMPLVERAGVFAVHILDRDQAELGTRFAKSGKSASELFDGLGLRSEVTGSPILEQCLAWLDCRVETALPVGDHTVFVGEVLAAGQGRALGAAEPVVYYDRSFRVLDPTPLP